MTVQIRISFTWLLGSMLLFISCSTSRNGYRRAARHIQSEITTSPVFNRAFTGFTLLDPETGRWLADVNGDHYFTPASNTKIFTLYTSLKVLGDSLPGLEVQQQIGPDGRDKALLVRGTGDPTFLHPFFQAWQQPFLYLKQQQDSILLFPETAVLRFGPGWCWDDYPYGYQAERSTFPIYGNVVQIQNSENKTLVSPHFFQNYFQQTSDTSSSTVLSRQEFSNQWILPKTGLKEEQWFPFTAANLADLLEDTLKRPVQQATSYGFETTQKPWTTLYAAPLDTVLRRLMYQSDNFIAEQLLFVCARKKYGVFDQDTLIQWMLDSVLHDLPQRPRWVDGSGLSRYNLMTPQSIATILLHLWREHPQDELMRLFPVGGVSGTLSGWYGGKDGKPYVFAKTGSMSGVSCLSGYVRTRHGKILIFSFMNNNFVGSSREWKQEMQRMLEMIQDW